mgnify:CR=1 FL=1
MWTGCKTNTGCRPWSIYRSCGIKYCDQPITHIWVTMDSETKMWSSFERCCYHTVGTYRDILFDKHTGRCGFCGIITEANVSTWPPSKDRSCPHCAARRARPIMSTINPVYYGLSGERISKETYDALNESGAFTVAQKQIGHIFIKTAWVDGKYVSTIQDDINKQNVLTKIWDTYSRFAIEEWHQMIEPVIEAAVGVIQPSATDVNAGLTGL